MKKTLLTLVMALVMTSVAFAQDNNNQRRQGQRPDPEQMVQAMTDRMATTYGLNDTQKASLLQLNKEYVSKLPRMGGPRGGRPGGRQGFGGGRPNGDRPQQVEGQRQRPSQEEMEKRRKEVEATQEAYNAGLKKIFTDEQYKKFTADQQKRQGNRGGQRERKAE